MNLPALNAYLQGRGVPAPAGQPPARSPSQAPSQAPSQHPSRTREATASATPTAAQPQDTRHRPQDARPVLDLSDPALTRRDIPRGSIVDIVA